MAVGLGGGLVVLLVIGLVVVYVMTRGGPAPMAAGPAPVPPGMAAPQNPMMPAPGGAPLANAAPVEAPPGLYGDQGGDEVAPADPKLPDTILRARADDTFYRLSNPRVGRPTQGFRPGEALMVDYEVVRRGKYNGNTLVIHSGDGRRHPVRLTFFGPQRDRGTFELTTFGPFGGFPKNAELYMTNGDYRYGHRSPTFKVSNSVVLGTMGTLTKARNWTAEEIARYTKDPPNHTAANVHPKVGKDTEFVGDTTGGGPMRYVEPAGHLLGLEHRLGEWEKEKCIGGLTAVFRRDQEPMPGQTRVVAKDGYAVGGVEVHAQKFVDAVRLKYMKVRPDGTLDKNDTYTSDWIGYPGEGAPKVLAGDGRKVIGLHLRQGAVLNALALVTDKAGG